MIDLSVSYKVWSGLFEYLIHDPINYILKSLLSIVFKVCITMLPLIDSLFTEIVNGASIWILKSDVYADTRVGTDGGY